MPNIKLGPGQAETEDEVEEASERELLQEILHVLKRLRLALVVGGTAADIDGAGDLDSIAE